MESCKVVTAKMLHVIIGGFAENFGEVVVGVGKERGDFLKQKHGCYGSEGA